MRAYTIPILVSFLLTFSATSYAQDAAEPFTGTWSIDLRTSSEKKEKLECGTATFKLNQTGNKVVGEHYMATVRCSRLNEGGEGSVKGLVVGGVAVLAVTSGRNGQIVMGSSVIRAGALHWQVAQEIKPGEPEGDTGLILQSGVMRRGKP